MHHQNHIKPPIKAKRASERAQDLHKTSLKNCKGGTISVKYLKTLKTYNLNGLGK